MDLLTIETNLAPEIPDDQLDLYYRRRDLNQRLNNKKKGLYLRTESHEHVLVMRLYNRTTITPPSKSFRRRTSSALP